MFEEPLTMAATRNWCGDFFEEAMAVLLGGRRLRTDSTCDVCPDVVVEEVRYRKVEHEDSYPTLDFAGMDRRYFEAKSLGTNGEALVYEARLVKDRAFVDEGNDLTVAMWHHGFAVGKEGGAGLSELRASLASSARSLTLVPFDEYERIMRSQPLRDFGGGSAVRSGGGFGSEKYREGRRCRLRIFEALATRRDTLRGFAIHGQAFGPIEVRSVRPFALLPDERGQTRLVLS